MVDENALTIYTDGSSFKSPRVGGIGVRFVYIDSAGNEQAQNVQFTGYKDATNNEMELLACIKGLEEAMRLQLSDLFPRIVIISDSLYVIENVNNAKFLWPKTKWYRKGGSPVLNAKLWKDLVKFLKKLRKSVEFRWVRGHHKDEHNKIVDKLARESARVPFNQPLSIVHVRRKHSPLSVDIGSVSMHGQRLSIRIITTEWLEVQRLWKYKYEVISKGSKYRNCIDLIFSDVLLKPGHHYYVVVNDTCDNPRIMKVFRELPRK